MTNFKKLALGLLVAVFAVGFSAFKSIKPIVNTENFTIHYYGWNEDENEYQEITMGLPNLGSCEEVGEEVCVVTLDTEETAPESIPFEDIGDYDLNPYSTAGVGSYFNN